MKVKRLTADQILAAFDAAEDDIQNALACKLGDDSISGGLKFIPWGSTLVDTDLIPKSIKDDLEQQKCSLEDAPTCPVVAILLTDLIRHFLKNGIENTVNTLPQFKVYDED